MNAPHVAQAGQAPPGIRLTCVGCRTTRERNARGEGLSVYAVDGEAGAWSLRQLIRDLVDPSFLGVDDRGSTPYAVHGDSSEASAFRIEAGDGTLTLLDGTETRGKNPVHLAVDPATGFS